MRLVFLTLAIAEVQGRPVETGFNKPLIYLSGFCRAFRDPLQMRNAVHETAGVVWKD